jgi:hypothetical protein
VLSAGRRNTLINRVFTKHCAVAPLDSSIAYLAIGFAPSYIPVTRIHSLLSLL